MFVAVLATDEMYSHPGGYYTLD